MLPSASTRDYYLKTEPRFVEARAKYLAHVAKMFELAGVAPEQAKQDADTVFAFEKRLAEASKRALEQAGRFKQPIATQIVAAAPFYPA